MEITPAKEKRISLYFHISVFLKGVISLLEIVGGVLAFFVPVSYVTNVVVHLAQGELIEDPGDFVSTHLVQFAHQLSVTSGTFIAIYLLSRGLVKFALVVALLRNQLWAYPSSLVVLGLFVVYQMYQITTAFSSLLVFLTVFDLIVMWFIWQEYQVVKYEHAHL